MKSWQWVIRVMPAQVLAVSSALVLLSSVGAAHADEPTPPKAKPERPTISELLTPADERRLRRGLRLAERGGWDEVRDIAEDITDPTAQRILLWRAAQSDYRASFGQLAEALEGLNNWPRSYAIRDEAEAKLFDSNYSASYIIDWFDKYPPVSGEGRIALAGAYLDAGRTEEGEELLKDTWRNYTLPQRVQSTVAQRYRSRLSRADHEARVDYLLWRGYRSTAWALRDYISSDFRKLTLARIRLMARQSGVDAAVAAVPSRLQNHPGLLYERARWRRRAGRRTDARPLVLAIEPPLIPIAAEHVWTERRIHVGYMLKARDYATAYRLAKDHGLEEGVEFADAEWLAGWLALTKLGDAEAAAQHFATLEAGVSTPISRGRALYWQGRAAEAMGNSVQATSYYREAGQFPTVFYGQLALERLGAGSEAYLLPPSVNPTPQQRAAFQSRDLVRALMMLAEMDESRLFRDMAYHLDDELTDPVDIALLAEIALDYGQPGIAVRGAKAGMMNGIFETNSAYPLIELPSLYPNSPEPAFVFAIMRQESELNPQAVSSAGARGMMQLLPATALRTARSIGEAYRRNWLTDDPGYNIMIGSRHLGDLVNDFDGSYILAAAAYNAGASRSRQWIIDYGDPRDPNVDPVDWIESIPFKETRNYVQRVMEAMQVYRARLNSGEIQLSLTDDLKRGG